MSMTPPPRLRAARRAGSMLAAGLGAALVAAAVVAGRRTGARRGRSGAGVRKAAPPSSPTLRPAGSGRAATSGRAPVSRPPGGDPHRPELPRRRADAKVVPPAGPAPAAVSMGAAPAEPALSVEFLSELHDRFRAEFGQDVGAGPPGPNGAAPLAAAGPGAGAADHQAEGEPIQTAPPQPQAPDGGPAPDGDRRAEGDMAGVGPAGTASAAGAQGAAGGQDGEAAAWRRWLRAAGPAAAPGVERGRRVVAAVVVTGVFMALLAALAIGRSGDGPDGGTGPGPSTQPGSSAPSTASAAGMPATPQEAFARARERLQSAGSFTYSGLAHARDVSRVRPGLWLGVDLGVSGEVDLVAGRVHETALASGGGATETVTDASRAWGRSAPSIEALAAQPYQPILEETGTEPAPMGAALLPVWLSFAVGAQDTGLDGAGRPTFRATVPAGAIGELESGQPPADAQIVLTLDPSGEPARVQLTSLPDGAELNLTLDLSGLGAPVEVVPPAPTG